MNAFASTPWSTSRELENGGSPPLTFGAEAFEQFFRAVAIVVSQQKLHVEHHGFEKLRTFLLDDVVQEAFHLLHTAHLLHEFRLHHDQLHALRQVGLQCALNDSETVLRAAGDVLE